MKRPLVIILLLIAAVSLSCKDKSNPVEKYGDTLIDKYKKTREFGDQVSLQRLQDAVRTFHITNGRYPEDLEEIEDFTGTTLDHDKYEYDSSTGVIASKE